MKKALILANGDAPLITQINYLKINRFSTLLCADGGANTAKKLNLIPDVIIGDLDSISESTKKYFQEKSEIIHLKRQNDTDVEKCLKCLIKKRFDEVILLGATGDRLDHSICNLGIILKYFNKIKISILHQNSFLQAYDSDIEFRTVTKELISVYGFDNNTVINSHGLKYPLKNITLPFGVRESTSNVALGNKVKLQIKGGIVFVIRDFNLIKKYDLI